ncbi:MAG: hypothetical protein Q4D57_01460 [Clostridia bacterium]|nr:hypothetical protein [Clostridia bacterium]
MISVGGFVGEIIVHFLVCSGLVVGGTIGTIGCAQSPVEYRSQNLTLLQV